MHCPKDHSNCELITLHDVEIDRCPRCQGVWLEQEEVKRLVEQFSVPGQSEVDELLTKWESAESEGTSPKNFWSEGKLICPREGAQMQKHYFVGTTIGLDHCLVCKGFWFDAGELGSVAKNVESTPEQDEAWRLFIRANREMLDKEYPEDKRSNDDTLPILASVFPGANKLVLVFVLVSFVIDYIRKEKWIEKNN